MNRFICYSMILFGLTIAMIGGFFGFHLALFAIVYPNGGGIEEVGYLLLGIVPVAVGGGLIWAAIRTLRSAAARKA